MTILTNEELINILKSSFLKRDDNSNKGNFGNSLIIGGSKYYIGAPSFSIASLSEIVMRLGSGTSSILVPDILVDSLYNNIKFSAIYSCKSSNGYIKFDKDILDKISSKTTSVAIGMGMANGDAKTIVNYLIDSTNAKIVIDADALKECIGIEFKNRCVLTPHIGEFSKMIGVSIDEVLNNQIDLATKFSKEYNCILVLKSAHSIVTDGERVYINQTGNAKLSKGGSGDVLSGIIAGILSYSNDLFVASVLGSYILGRCAEKSNVNEYSCLPTDIIEQIPFVIEEIQKGQYNI